MPDGSLMPYTPDPDFYWRPCATDEALRLAKSFGKKLVFRKKYFGASAEMAAVRAAKVLGYEWVVVRGDGKFAGVFLLTELVPNLTGAVAKCRSRV